MIKIQELPGLRSFTLSVLRKRGKSNVIINKFLPFLTGRVIGFFEKTRLLVDTEIIYTPFPSASMPEEVI
jgi:hypothetical protein